MTTFIVDGHEVELSYDFDGIDVSGDFIGNTDHGMGEDGEGRYIASREDFEWWKDTIAKHEQLDAAIKAYKDRFSTDEVEQVVNDWSGHDLDVVPGLVLMGLEKAFGKI